MKRLIRLAIGVAVIVGVVPVLAGPASGHDVSGTTISCSEVSGTFHDFGTADHPIVWHVAVGRGATQTVATVETPAGFAGSGTASAGIATLTDQLAGTSAMITAFATWPGGQSATTSTDLACGVAAVAPTTSPTTPPLQVAGTTAVAPAAAATATPAAPVPAAATFTG
jgi:hypothetical protein